MPMPVTRIDMVASAPAESGCASGYIAPSTACHALSGGVLISSRFIFG